MTCGSGAKNTVTWHASCFAQRRWSARVSDPRPLWQEGSVCACGNRFTQGSRPAGRGVDEFSQRGLLRCNRGFPRLAHGSSCRGQLVRGKRCVIRSRCGYALRQRSGRAHVVLFGSARECGDGRAIFCRGIPSEAENVTKFSEGLDGRFQFGRKDAINGHRSICV